MVWRTRQMSKPRKFIVHTLNCLGLNWAGLSF